MRSCSATNRVGKWWKTFTCAFPTSTRYDGCTRRSSRRSNRPRASPLRSTRSIFRKPMRVLRSLGPNVRPACPPTTPYVSAVQPFGVRSTRLRSRPPKQSCNRCRPRLPEPARERYDVASVLLRAAGGLSLAERLQQGQRAEQPTGSTQCVDHTRGRAERDLRGTEHARAHVFEPIIRRRCDRATIRTVLPL